MSVRSRALRALPVVLPLLFVGAWWLVQQREYAYSIPVRTDTFATTPYAVAILVGFAVSCAMVPRAPLAACGLVAGLLALQVAFWPDRFSQTGWTAYLLLLLLAGSLGAYTPEKWRRALLCAVVFLGLVVAALLNLPSLSYSGQWGTINGKGWASNELWIGWATWSVVITLFVLLSWRAGAAIRRKSRLDDEPADAVVPVRPNLNSLLTAREYEIFCLVGQGLTNHEIAATAHISVTTVKTHIAHILAKTNSSSRAKLIALAHTAQTPDRSDVLAEPYNTGGVRGEGR